MGLPPKLPERRPIIELYDEQAVLCAAVSDGFVVLYITPRGETSHANKVSFADAVRIMSPDDGDSTLGFAKLTNLYVDKKSTENTVDKFELSGIKVICHPNQKAYSP
jgi:hypothetical protein